MTDRIAVILIIALAFDALANVARLVAVEIQYRRQARLIRRQGLESDRHIDMAVRAVAGIVKQTVEVMNKGEL